MYDQAYRAHGFATFIREYFDDVVWYSGNRGKVRWLTVIVCHGFSLPNVEAPDDKSSSPTRYSLYTRDDNADSVIHPHTILTSKPVFAIHHLLKTET